MPIYLGKTMKIVVTTGIFWFLYVIFGYEFAVVTALALVSGLLMNDSRFIL
jgi:hypothetical protein